MRRGAQGARPLVSADPTAVPYGLPRSYLRPVLLLLLAEGSAHGYDLLEQLPDLNLERTDAGSLYRSLRAMEQDGFVRSWWEESPSGPARRTYELTDEGLEWLHVWSGSLAEVHRTLGRYLDRYATVARSAEPEPR
jgi:PadR family transcriptional regulator, regulatory protein PadR